jgi:L-galactono-1,4-lactone dehydrogenase
MWLPNTDKVVVVISNPVGDDEEVDIPPSSTTINPLAQLLSDLQGSKFTIKVEELSKLSFAELRDRLIAVAPLDPEHIAAVNNAEASYWETLGLGSGTRCEDSIDVLGFDCGGEQHVLEVCFPMGSAWRKDHRQAQDVDAVKKILRVIEEQKLPAASPIEQRWTSSSTSTMSPASSDNREDTFTWIGIIQYIPADADETLKNEVKQAFERYVEAIEPILEEYKAVPHWAKIEPIQGEGERKQKQKEAIAARYNLKEFREAKKELDPNNLFSLGIYESVLN